VTLPAPEDPASRGRPPSGEARFRYALRLADTPLVLGQRLGEWVGHAPALEEDLALANIALEGRGRDEDALAFLRDAPQFCNVSLAEQPNGDFGHTIVRQFLLDAWQLEMHEALTGSTDTRLAQIAAKAVKETRYHLRFSAGWVVRLGDGTEESHARVQSALAALWRFTGELLTPDALDEEMAAAGIGPSLPALRRRWDERVDAVLEEGTLKRPAEARYPWHGKRGVHTEHLGHMLAEMQHLPRTYPGAAW
jgi:ring-1,2-phenylacetyl-CoA epoxidase subunit PaaC